MTERHHPLAECERCPLYEQDTYVPSTLGGGTDAIVGEAPGWHELDKGAPFVGPSGRLLGRLLAQAGAGTRLADATITNALSCKPGTDSVPAKAIACCAPRLRAELEGAQRVLALGRSAAAAVTGRPHKISDTPTITVDQWQGRPVVVAPHPAAMLRAPVWESRLRAGIDRWLALEGSAQVTWEWPPFTVAQSMDDLLEDNSYEPVVIDTEHLGSTAWDRFDVARIHCVGLSFPDGSIAVVPGDMILDERLGAMLTDRGVIGHAVKGDQGILARRGIASRLAGDTMLASARDDEVPGGRSLGSLAARYGGIPDWKPADVARFVAEAADEEVWAYNARDIAATRALMEAQRERGSWDHRLHRELLVPASEFLRAVEDHGMAVDDGRAAEILGRYEAAYGRVRAKVSALWGSDVTWRPHEVARQLAAAGVEVADTSKETLRDLIAGTEGRPRTREAYETLLTARKLGKVLSTYLRPLVNRHTGDGRVHAEFNPIGTETGRLTSARPNMQNWPRPIAEALVAWPPALVAELGDADVRSCFWAGPGRVLVTADLSQAELRVIAVESGDPALLAICKDPAADLHREVAEAVGILRVQAKGLNFGLAFGRTEYGLVQGLGVDGTTGRRIVAAYFARFPGVRRWQDGIRAKVAAGTPLETVFGRIRRPLDISLLDHGRCAEAEREILAFPSQAIVSDITLSAGIEAWGQGAVVVNMVHDSITAECEADQAGDVASVLRAAVREAGHLYTERLEFPVDVKTSTNWS